MDIRTTSFSTLRSQPKSISLEHHNRSNNINKSSNFNPSTEIKPKRKFLSIIPISKTQPKKLNDTFILPEKSVLTQATATADKKGVLLYQQVEKNKITPNGMELINRFHFKV